MSAPVLAAALGVLAGVLADMLAAGSAGQRPRSASLGVAAVLGAALGLLFAHVRWESWHARLEPVWLWGWLLASDLDLRIHEIRNDLLVGMVVLAGAGAVLDGQALVAVAGGAGVGVLGVAVNGGGRRFAPLVASRQRAIWAAAAGAAVTAAGVASWLYADTWSWPLQGWADPRLRVIASASVLPVVVVAGLHAISRVADGYEPIGWADVVLLVAIALWFGLRWMWGPIIVGLGAAAAVGVTPWALTWCTCRSGVPHWIPTVPWLAMGLALSALAAGIRH